MSHLYMKSKKGSAAGTVLVDIAAIIGIVGIFLFASFLITGKSAAVEERITTETDAIGDQISLFTYLRTPVNDKIVAEIIAENYLKDEYDELQQVTNNIFKTVYKKNAQWELFIDNDEKVSEGSVNEATADINEIIELPLPNKRTITVQLKVHFENE